MFYVRKIAECGNKFIVGLAVAGLAVSYKQIEEVENWVLFISQAFLSEHR